MGCDLAVVGEGEPGISAWVFGASLQTVAIEWLGRARGGLWATNKRFGCVDLVMHGFCRVRVLIPGDARKGDPMFETTILMYDEATQRAAQKVVAEVRLALFLRRVKVAYWKNLRRRAATIRNANG